VAQPTIGHLKRKLGELETQLLSVKTQEQQHDRILDESIGIGNRFASLKIKLAGIQAKMKRIGERERAKKEQQSAS